MKIAHAIRHYNKVTGSSRVVAELSENFIKDGHEVHVYTSSWIKDAPKEIIFHKVPVFKLNFPFEISSFTFMSTYMLRNQKYDIIHNHGDSRAVGVYTCHGIHSYFHIKKMAPSKPSSLDRYIMNREYFIYGKRNYKKIIAISDLIKRQIIESFNVPANDIAVVHNGVNVEEFSSNKAEKRLYIRKKYAISKDEIILLFVAYGFVRKGLDVALKALALLKNLPFKLFVVGKDENMRKFTAETKRLGLDDKVIYTGPTKEISSFFAASDIFVFPSVAEPLGLVELEAMSAGLPSIVSPPRVNGGAELMENGKDGIILEDHKDPDELAEKIRKLIENEALRKTIGMNAVEKAKEYSWNKVAQRTLNVYNIVIANKGS
ncbi:glycosyltransferase family 4 protein [Candidatus Margulisiibacteriota bacterium]